MLKDDSISHLRGGGASKAAPSDGRLRVEIGFVGLGHMGTAMAAISSLAAEVSSWAATSAIADLPSKICPARRRRLHSAATACAGSRRAKAPGICPALAARNDY